MCEIPGRTQPCRRSIPAAVEVEGARREEKERKRGRQGEKEGRKLLESTPTPS